MYSVPYDRTQEEEWRIPRGNRVTSQTVPKKVSLRKFAAEQGLQGCLIFSINIFTIMRTQQSQLPTIDKHVSIYVISCDINLGRAFIIKTLNYGLNFD